MKKCECNTMLTSKHLAIDEVEEVEKILLECVRKKLLKKRIH